MSPAESWLRERLPAAPEPLLATMIASLAAGESTVPATLAAGALALYGQVIRGSGGREDALPLLAADALFTHALEAQAELDPGGVAALAAAWGGGGRLGEVLP